VTQLSVEQKTRLHIKEFSLPEDIAKKLITRESFPPTQTIFLIDSTRPVLFSEPISPLFLHKFILDGLENSVFKTETVGSSETSINASNITQCINPEDKHTNLHPREGKVVPVLN
jgi:hypothetical protein